MRTLYIALIFVGCLSLALGVGQEVIPARTPAAACSNGAASATGCKTCDTTKNECTAADTEKGYYLDGTTKQAVACPRACKTCSDKLVCTDCQTDGFADAVAPAIKCQVCKAGYTPDNGVANTATQLDAVCISVAEDGPNSCFTGFTWNSLPSITRQCIADTANCLTGYDRTTAKMNCDKCDSANQYTQIIKSQAQNGNNIWIWTQQCIKPTALPAARVVKQCTDANPTDSCATCTAANNCATAKPGFFVNTQRLRGLSTEANGAGSVSACPPQCAECDNEKSCKSCDPTLGYQATVDATSKWCLCDATKGYTPSILKSNIKLDTPVSYNCVNQALGQSCDALYTWSAPYQLPLSVSTNIPTCISPIQTDPCYVDPRKDLGTQQNLVSLTSFWNQTVNPKRTCILASTGKCPDNYATKPAQTNEVTPLAGDCTECASGATLSGSGTDTTCVPGTSSILVMSLAFLGLLLALVF